MTDFDKVLDRRGTASAKWDQIKKRGYPEDTLAMWVADMDFEVMPEIQKAVLERATRVPVYGYSIIEEGHHEAVCDWMKRRHGWTTDPAWIAHSPGVVPAFKIAVQVFSSPGDGILIQRPVYYPFFAAINGNERRLVNNPLTLVKDRYEIDFDDFEHKIVSEKVKIFILCNPHNPVGRVYTRDELKRLGDICLKHGVIVVADEIHMDFTFAPHRHVPFLSVDPEFEKNTLLCTAPSKTFNIAGLQHANIFIANKDLRDRFVRFTDNTGISSNNIFGSVATKAAYLHGDSWVDDLLEYLKGNFSFLDDYLKANMPGVKLIPPEGLYLSWVDFRSFGLSNEDLEHFMLYEAKLWIDEGYIFGAEGSGFERLVLACPRVLVKDALERIKEAAQKRKLI